MKPEEIDEMRTLIRRAIRNTDFVRASCYGKQAFETVMDASRAIRRPGLESYRCQHCGMWHVGHVRRIDGSRGREMRVL